MPFDSKPDSSQIGEIGTLLIGAAAALREYGWCQGKLRSHYGAMCLVGAIAFVDTRRRFGNFGDLGMTASAHRALRHVFNVLGGRWASAWNDEPGRTAEEVIALLERAATVPEMTNAV